MRQKLSLSKCRINADKSIAAQIYDFLRHEIVNTHIKPGALFSENELSEHFEVSRQPVREALMRLRFDGLLAVYPQRGSVVRKISVSNLKQICFVRTAIETAALKNALNLPAEELSEIIQNLRANLAEQRQIEDGAVGAQDFLQKDDEYHKLICSLSGCPMAWNTVQSIKGQMDRIRYLSNESVSPCAVLTDEHELIVDKIEQGQIDEACQALTSHLSEILATYIPIRRDHEQWFLPEDEDKI